MNRTSDRQRLFIEVSCYQTNERYRSLALAMLNAPGSQHGLALRFLKLNSVATRAVPRLKRFLGTRRVESTRLAIDREVGTTHHRVTIGEGVWRVTCTQTPVDAKANGTDITTRFELVSGVAANVGVGLGVIESRWSDDDYVCAPGGAYDGNRFETWNDSFPPFLPRSRWSADLPTTTTEIPSLDRRPGQTQGKLQLPAGDLCTPAIGVLDRYAGRATWILTEPSFSGVGSGVVAEVSASGTSVSLGAYAPAVREETSFHLSSLYPSWDKGAEVKCGDHLDARIRIYDYADGQTLPSFFESFAGIRNDLVDATALTHCLPLSEAWRIHEERYNESYWDEQRSYYRVGQPYTLPESIWTSGWVGGLQAVLPLLYRGNETSIERALRNLAFFFSPAGQAPSGIYYTVSDGTDWGGDDHYLHKPIGTKRWALVRRTGDSLYSVVKCLLLLEAKGLGEEIHEEWETSLRRCADALCTLWEQNGEFGQYIDPQTLKIRIGNSWAGSIVPAGLALAGDRYHSARFRRVAEQSLLAMYERFCEHGYTTGGPGDILQAPDSESTMNLLESLIVLYEVTGDRSWLSRAQTLGYFCLTWFFNYDFTFPADSSFAEHDMRTIGACFASVQNKCAVPNICTLSGDALWKLFRYSGEAVFMETIQLCLHNAQQYISTAERPIRSRKLESGFLENGNMNECIQTGDWSGPTGEIPYHLPISWSEVANMLGICEVPGIYVVTDQRRVFVSDHVEVTIEDGVDDRLVVTINNPTGHDATVSLLAEDAAAMQRILGPLPLLDVTMVTVPKRSCVEHVIVTS